MAKTIRHAKSGEFKRVSDDEAERLVKDRAWVYSSKFEAKRAMPTAPRPSARQRLLLKGLEAAGALLALIIITMLMAGYARAADKPVPFRVCLNQAQAAQVYKGKPLKYRLIKDENGRQEACWYAGKTLPKFAFIPRSTSVAISPALLPTMEQPRVEGSSGAVPEPRAQFISSGTPEPQSTFEAMWARAMRDVAGR